MESVIAPKLATGFELHHLAAGKKAASNLSKNQRAELRLLYLIFKQQTSSPQ